MIVIIVEQLPEGVWLATSPDVPGLTVEMPTRDEAIAHAREVAAQLIALKPPIEYGLGGTIYQHPKLKNLKVWNTAYDHPHRL